MLFKYNAFRQKKLLVTETLHDISLTVLRHQPVS